MLKTCPLFLLLSMSCCRASLCLDSLFDSCNFLLMFSSILVWIKFLAFKPCRRRILSISVVSTKQPSFDVKAALHIWYEESHILTL